MINESIYIPIQTLPILIILFMYLGPIIQIIGDIITLLKILFPIPTDLLIQRVVVVYTKQFKIVYKKEVTIIVHTKIKSKVFSQNLL